MISKIIHQTAPTNKNLWHPLWFKCQESWLKNFSDFEYKIWDDESIDKFVKEKFSNYWDMYNEFNIHILKIDFVRYCFLYEFGGIYADMDVFCYKNFYNELIYDVILVENPYGNDPIENSLMASSPKHPFWIECMNLCVERYYNFKDKFPQRLEDLKEISSHPINGLKVRPLLVFNITGTNLISSAFRMTNFDIATFAGKYYNNNYISYDLSYRTKHIHTGLWGKESQNLFFKKELQNQTLHNILIEEFDFYKDYTEGNFLKDDFNDFYRNDADKNNIKNLKYSYF